MTLSSKPVPHWRTLVKPADFHHTLSAWSIFARARFELVPDYSDRLFTWGENARLASCSLDGHGSILFQRPLRSPLLRAYMGETHEPVQLLEVTRYGVVFKTVGWQICSNRTEEFIFECQLAA
jgi:hypothetical protein